MSGKLLEKRAGARYECDHCRRIILLGEPCWAPKHQRHPMYCAECAARAGQR